MEKVYGPYTRKDGRLIVVLYNNQTKKRITKSYPRYLMEQKLGRELTKDEEIDHKDNDFTNNDIDNLQIITGKDNRIKEIERRYGKPEIFICPNCGIEITRSKTQIRSDRIFCSNSCRSLWYRRKERNERE